MLAAPDDLDAACCVIAADLRVTARKRLLSKLRRVDAGQRLLRVPAGLQHGVALIGGGQNNMSISFGVSSAINSRNLAS